MGDISDGMLEKSRLAAVNTVRRQERFSGVVLMKKGIAFALVALCSILVCTALAGSEKKLDALLAMPVRETTVFVEPNEEPLFLMLKRSLSEESDQVGRPLATEKEERVGAGESG